MLLQSLLVSPLYGAVAMLVLLRTFSPSHPAHVETCALPNDEHRLYKWSFQAHSYSLRGGAGLISYCGLSHPPTLRTSRRALCPTTSTHYINGTSKLACCASFEGYACRSHCARGGSTSLDFTIRLVPRAHSGSTGAMCVSFISYSGVRVRRAQEINQP